MTWTTHAIQQQQRAALLDELRNTIDKAQKVIVQHSTLGRSELTLSTHGDVLGVLDKLADLAGALVEQLDEEVTR